jgi:hypothetical protein
VSAVIKALSDLLWVHENGDWIGDGECLAITRAAHAIVDPFRQAE